MTTKMVTCLHAYLSPCLPSTILLNHHQGNLSLLIVSTKTLRPTLIGGMRSGMFCLVMCLCLEGPLSNNMNRESAKNDSPRGSVCWWVNGCWVFRNRACLFNVALQFLAYVLLHFLLLPLEVGLQINAVGYCCSRFYSSFYLLEIIFSLCCILTLKFGWPCGSIIVWDSWQEVWLPACW